MPYLPYPITANTIEEFKTQIYELLRQILEDKIGGLDLGDVFANDGDFLSLRLSSTGGLEKNSHEVQIFNKSDGGLTSTASGEYIKCKPSGGLETDVAGLFLSSSGASDFSIIACPAGTNPVADTVGDTLTLANGTGISITGNQTTDTVTIGLDGTVPELDVAGVERVGALRIGNATNNIFVCAGGIEFFNGTAKNQFSGTWTASFVCETSGTITIDPNSKTGWYRKIGDVVLFGGSFAVSSVSSPVGTLILEGLPYEASGNIKYISSVSILFNTLNAGMSSYVGYVNAGTKNIIIYGWADATATSVTAASPYIKAGSQIIVNGSYITD
jgi:hypothetical protein